MARFIIWSGWQSTPDVVDAKDIDEARGKAAERSMLEGLLDDDLADTTGAEVYSEECALRWGLIALDERDFARRAWQSQAPWR